MPLKSATCGRELEAGLRRRPGSNNVTFDGKPLDGVFGNLRSTRSNGQGALTAKSAPRLALLAGNNGKFARARIASFGRGDS